MRYIFFDIECANCFNGQGKICSFGYVITDTQFNIIEQKDILINPKTKFHFGKKEGEEDSIELAYPFEMFNASPDFNYYYDTIRKLLTVKDQVVFGHSVLNDIHFLLSECDRYNKDTFAYTAFDTQVLYMLLHNESSPTALSKLCTKYGIETTHLHRSDFDAYLTMQLLQALCIENKTSFDGLREQFPNANYTVSEDGSVKNNFFRKSNTRRLFDYASHFKLPKELPETPLTRQHFCFSKEFEELHFKQALFLVKELRLKGAYYCTRPKICQYYVKTVPNSETDLKVEKAIEEGKEIKIISLEEFLEMLKIEEDFFKDISLQSITKIKQIRY